MKKSFLLLLALMTLVFAGQAFALPYNETGDAGETLATAQSLGAGTTVVYGSLAGDADMFYFGWGGGSFYVNTVGTSIDSQLFLFNSSGQGVQANDDGIAFAGPAYLQLANLVAGNYYLGVSFYNNDPLTADGSLMFQSSPYQPLYGPLDSNAVLDHWGGGTRAGDYVINFSTTTGQGDLGDPNPTGNPNPVPEPSTYVLLGSGLVGLGIYNRKRKKV